MMHSRIAGIIATVAMSVTLSAASFAAPVGIFGTGVGVSEGAADARWSYAYDTNGPPMNGQAVVLTFPDHHYLPGFGTPVGDWVPNQSNAKWISTSDSDTTIPTSSGFTGENVRVTYATSFDLAAFVANSVALAINWTGDDDLERVLLNGNVVHDYSGTCCGWGILHALQITTGFVRGTNTLAFEVRNDDNFKEGIIVQASGEGQLLADADTPVPAPATLPLLAAGLIALRALRRH